jgi:hypothetical protein
VAVAHPVSKTAKAQDSGPADLNTVIMFIWVILSFDTDHSKVKHQKIRYGSTPVCKQMHQAHDQPQDLTNASA